MPLYTDAEGNGHNIPDWDGNGNKARVINRAYRQSKFWVIDMPQGPQVFFQCVWCKGFITSAGVQGDHVAPQSTEARLRSNALLNMELSCSECNGGSRNQNVRKTRASYKKDRDARGIR